MFEQSLSGKWEFNQAGKTEWLPITVPGDVHTALIAAEAIPDPFFGDNELAVQWVAETDWEYRYTFDVNEYLLTKERIYLVCDGIDTLASIYLNDQLIGRVENMFRQYRWEVKSLLKSGINEIRLYFDSVVRAMSALQEKNPMLGVSQAIPGGPYIRKAPCQFGWDWGPMLPPIGIWKEVRLEAYDQAKIEEIHVRQHHRSDGVSISTDVSIDKWGINPLQVELILLTPDGTPRNVKTSILGSTGSLSMEIPDPELWWPNGYGKQPLYHVQIKLWDQSTLLDQRDLEIGLRTIELHQEPDEWGRSFTFLVNGVPVFAKGSNWIPADSFPTRLTDAHLEHLIRSAADTHQNMLRVWGGGFYEEERFYNLCDRYGILIWQDMIFSCSVYPLNQVDFLTNVEQEIRQNIIRLRYHPSLALWCGNNEMEMGWEMWNWMPRAGHLRDAYAQFFYVTLPGWVKELDPDHAYWPSSPSSDTPFINVNGEIQGDAHYWDVWHGRKPFTAYRSTYPRFMSEFGFQSLPPLNTIRTYADEKDWNMTSYVMEFHQRSGSGNGLMLAQMTDTFLMPKDFPSLVYLSLVLQAEGIRYGIEHWRRHKNRVSGTLYWQLNDCWPVASWSSLDYFGRWKALHYAARRFYKPVLLSIEDVGQTMHVHVTSDLIAPWEGTISWSLQKLTGEILESGEDPVSLAALESRKVLTRSFDLPIDQARDMFFLVELFQSGKRDSYALATFVPNKHLKLKDPDLVVKMSQSNDQLEISLTAQSLARFVELTMTDQDLIFSNNYFDLPANFPLRVSCPLPAGMTLDEARGKLRLMSLFDSY